MKKIIAILFILLSVSFFFADILNAKKGNTDIEDEYYPEFQPDKDMKASKSNKSFSNSGIQYGVWLTPLIIDKRNSVSSLTSFTTTTRVWLKSYLWENSYVYVRGKYNFAGVLKQKGYSQESTNHHVDLDVGFIDMATDKKNLRLSLGRKYFIMGSGLAFNGRGDGAEFDFYSRFINVNIMGAYTGLLLKDDNPYGLSDKDIANGARRVFVGGTVSTDIYNQTLYFLSLVQIDKGKDHTYPTLKSRYDSQYYGVGCKGVILDKISYYAEYIHERGKSYVNGSNRRDKIRAYAGIVNINYYLEMPLNPVIIAQYAAASGDRDRNDYRLPNGNALGVDNGFINFGTYVGGYGLRPLLSNIHVLRGGFAISPFSWSDNIHIKSINFVTKYSYYLKNKSGSPINNGFDAISINRNIGQGIDLSLRWLILSDISAFINYAVFFPGKAYENSKYYALINPVYALIRSESNRHFIMGGFNISF